MCWFAVRYFEIGGLTEITDSTSVPGAANSVTLTLRPSTAIGPGSTVVLGGLTFLSGGTLTVDITGAGAGLLAGGPTSEGSLDRTAQTFSFVVAGGQSIPAGSDSIFIFEVPNPATAPHAGLKASLTLSVSSSDIGFSSQTPFSGSPNLFRGTIELAALVVVC
jgi:hypothetical protein